MKTDQLKIITKQLIKSDLQINAVMLCFTDKNTPAQAERAIYGKITSTVARDVKRVNEMFDFCGRVHKAGLDL